MDRFKFRVRHKKNNSYIENAAIDSRGNVLKMMPEISLDTYIEIDKDEVIIEQCTGLKDKNGKLVYENDVVRFKFVNYEPCSDFYFMDYVVKNAVNHQGYQGLFLCHNSSGIESCEPMSKTDGADCFVFGNIHENHELLEKSK